MNAIGYMRLSAKDQSNSLEIQEQVITDYCKRNSIDLIGLYTDNGKTSYSFDRPDYKALELFIKKNKGKARYLIIKDHDRFSRNLPEALLKIDELQKRFQIKVLSTDEQVDIDTSDPAVFIQRAFNYLMANQELFRIRKRTSEGVHFAKLKGRYVNRPPFGYIRGKNDEGKAFMVVDETKAPIVQKIFADYLAGKSFFEVLQSSKAMGFNNTGNSSIRRILENHLYAGLIKFEKNAHSPEHYKKGQHKPLIKEVDFWLAQEMLGNKRASKTQPKEEFPLRGIVKCWCGQNMTAGYSKGKTKYYLYYRCLHHTEKNIPGAELHERFDEVLANISFSSTQVTRIRETVKSELSDAVKKAKTISKDLEKQRSEIERKVIKLEERLMNEDIEVSTYRRWLNNYNVEKAIITEKLTELTGINLKAKFEKLDRILPETVNMKRVYDELLFDDRKLLMKEVFKGNLMYSDGAFRTPYVHEVFRDNVLKMNEKGPLFLEQPDDVWDKFPLCSP